MGIIFLIDYIYSYKKLIGLLFTLLIFQAIMFIRPETKADTIYISKYWDNKNYKELYWQISSKNRNKYNWQTFNDKLLTYYENNNLPQIRTEFESSKSYFWNNESNGTLRIYNDLNNQFIYESLVRFVRENNKWKLVWEDKFLQ